MRMPVIGAAIGGLALGAIVVAGSRYVASPVQASIPAPSLGSTQLVSQGAGLASNPVLVDCADGQRALVKHVDVAGQAVAQVQCVGQPLVTNTFDEMSMNSTSIPVVKSVLRGSKLITARELAEHALSLPTGSTCSTPPTSGPSRSRSRRGPCHPVGAGPVKIHAARRGSSGSG